MPAFIDLTGKRFTRWTVIARAADYRPGFPQWLCRCDCGNEVVVRAQNLRSGLSHSCGCWRVENSRQTCIKRNTTHGRSGTAEHKTWLSMIHRCERSYYTNFRNYGARGITVCKRWHKFENFLTDMGLRPSELHSIERRDNGGNYTPSNCYWATKDIQANNTRLNRRLTLGDETLTLTQWADRLGMHRHTIANRLRLGWPTERVLSPIRYHCSGKPLATQD